MVAFSGYWREAGTLREAAQDLGSRFMTLLFGTTGESIPRSRWSCDPSRRCTLVSRDPNREKAARKNRDPSLFDVVDFFECNLHRTTFNKQRVLLSVRKI
jgi:hypothetical protein